MKEFIKTDNYTIYNGSVLDLNKVIKDNSIDSIITDPPYELGFMNKSWDKSGIAFQVDTWKKCYKALKAGGLLLAFGGSRTFHRIAVAIEDAGFEIRDTIMWLYGSGFPKSHNIGLAVDKLNNVESKVIDRVKGSGSTGINEYGNSQFVAKNKYEDGTFDLLEAQNEWKGWGTALKPAYEPIIIARKPFNTSVANNVIKNRVGGINIDECRIGDEGGVMKVNIKPNSASKTTQFGCDGDLIDIGGRFPANIIHDGSDEVISNMIEDDNNASRYFYTAKTSKKDRDEGLEHFKNKAITNKKGNGLGRVCNICGTPQLTPCDCENNSWILPENIKNIHPTVKPTDLMQYLIRLVNPKGATILDVFMGSGSTGKAVMFENRERDKQYKFIGIDLEEEYCKIASARIDYALNKYEYDYEQEIKEAEEKGQVALDLF